MTFIVTMPKLSPTMETGTIAKWHKKEGDQVAAGDLLLEVSTDKATVEHNALDPGYLRKILVQEGQEAAVNQPIALFTEKVDEPVSVPEETAHPQTGAPKPSQEASAPAAATPPPPPVEVKGERLLISPLARKLAKEQGINTTQIKGTGPGGRIVSRDLAQKGEMKTQEIALTPMRKVISQRLQQAKSTIPHFYVEQTIQADALVDFREQLSHLGTKVSYNDCVVKASALALREHPQVNSGFNASNQTLIQFGSIDISVAVSLPEGLITPIVFQADKKELQQISTEVRTLAVKAKENKLEPREFQGGSFTISNLGMFGITRFSAIINAPQACILAVGGIIDTPIIKNGAIVPGKVMTLTLSCDHRVVDGVAGAKFLKTLQNLLENPAHLLVTHV